MAHHKRKANRTPRPNLPAATVKTLEKVEQAVERVKTEQNLSRQPRFGAGKRPDEIFTSTVRWLSRAQLQEPEYRASSPQRDQWLRQFWKLEPHLAGVLSSIISIDKNRGWSLTGGRNQVNLYSSVLHDATAAPGLHGWRNFFSTQALSHYATDMGTICECGTLGEGGPLRALYHTDSARCWLTGDPDYPLGYMTSASGPLGSTGGQKWPAGSFFRVASMPSDDEKFHGLGFCAVSRCLEIAKIMVAVYLHDQEMLRARMPDGLLLLKGISQEQWADAMASREENLTKKERQYFGGVFVLASEGLDDVDAKLLALSQLPADFDLTTFTDQLMYAYALCVGYSPREVWPVSSGALGTASESETQDDNSTAKGEGDFTLNYAEQLGQKLPEALLYEFDERDAKGDLLVTANLQAKADLITTLSNWKSGEESVLLPEQIMQLGTREGLLPPEWTEPVDDITITDQNDAELSRLRSQYREHSTVLRAIETFPAEPIVRYHYPSGRTTVLWDSGHEAKRRTIFQGATAGADIRRLARAIENATRQASKAKADPAYPATGPAAPMVLVHEPDGQLHALRPEPQVVDHRIDLSPLTETFNAGLERIVRNIPAPVDPRDLALVVGETVGRVLAAQPKPQDPGLVADLVTRSIASLPKGPTAADLTTAILRALPEPQTVDYAALASALAVALAEAFKAMPAPVVNVQMPEQVAPDVEVQMPTKETADFEFIYDREGRITGAHKQGKSS